MEQLITARFNEAILHEAAQRYGIDVSDIHPLGGFESYIYEFAQAGQAYILRLAHSHRRSADLIRGEVDWINYLADGGVGVSKAIHSHNNELVEPIPDGHGQHFLATAFVKASGGSAWQSNKWHPSLFEEYGRLLGRMHTLSKTYHLPNPAWQRPHWDDPIMRDVMGWLPPDQKHIDQKFEDVITYLQTLPQDTDVYGMIHQDAHGGNFFVDDSGKITLFDFDDCCYSWYVYDVAMVIFYAITNRPDAVTFGQTFLKHFLRGYRQHNTLEARWLKEIPHFLKLRELDLYGVIHRSFDVTNLDSDRWVGQFMQERRQRLENDVPYVDIDFENF